MCLHYCLKSWKKKIAIWKIRPFGYIAVYKIVKKPDFGPCLNLYHSDIFFEALICGINSTKYGFHSFKTLKGAQHWYNMDFSTKEEVIIKCKIKRRWIKEIGKQLGHATYRTSKIKIPSIHNRKAIMETKTCQTK